jgi:hypothetical protein
MHSGPDFIGERIHVTTAGDPAAPASFLWRDQTHRVSSVLFAWSDWGFNPVTKHRNWRARRHRNYYRIVTAEQTVFEIYLDRGTKPGREAWILYQRLAPEPTRTA